MPRQRLVSGPERPPSPAPDVGTPATRRVLAAAQARLTVAYDRARAVRYDPGSQAMRDLRLAEDVFLAARRLHYRDR